MGRSPVYASSLALAAFSSSIATDCSKADHAPRNPRVVGVRDFFNLLRPLQFDDPNGGPVFSGSSITIRAIPRGGGGEQYELSVENGSAFVLDPGHSARVRQRYRIHAEFTIVEGAGGFGILFNARPIRDPTRWPISPAFLFDTKGYVQGKFFPLDESISLRHKCSVSNVRQVVTIDVDEGGATMRWRALATENTDHSPQEYVITLLDHRAHGGSWGLRLWNHTRVVLHDLMLDWRHDNPPQPATTTAIVIAPYVYLLHDAVDPLVRDSGKRVLQALRSNSSTKTVALMGTNARKPNIRWVLTEGRRHDRQTDLVMIFLIAQGKRERNRTLPCIHPAESMLQACEGTGFLTWELPFLIQAASNARIVFFIDSCQQHSLFDVFPKRLELLLRRNIVVITPRATMSYECDTARNTTCFSNAISGAITRATKDTTLGDLVRAMESEMADSDSSSHNEQGRYINVYSAHESQWRNWRL